MERRELTCIGCPMGCAITVEMDEHAIRSISGYTCARGRVYAEHEVVHPTRIVTSTVRVRDGAGAVVPVKTRSAIPKEKIFECVRELKQLSVPAPVHAGDVICAGVAGTDVDVIAVRDVAEAPSETAEF